MQKVVARPRILPEAVTGTDRGQQPAAARNLVAQLHHGGIESVPVPQQLLRPRIVDAVAVSGEPGIELQPRFAVVAGLGAAAVAHITRILHMFDVLQHRPEEAAPFLRRQLVVKPVVCDKPRKARVVEPLRQNPAAVAPFDEFDQQLQIPLRFLEIRPVAGRKIEDRTFERFGAAGGFHRVNRGVLVVQELFENKLPVLHLGDIGLEFQPGSAGSASIRLFMSSSSGLQSVFARSRKAGSVSRVRNMRGWSAGFSRQTPRRRGPRRASGPPGPRLRSM